MKLAMRIQHHATLSIPKVSEEAPPAHNVCFSAEDFGETVDDDIRTIEDIGVDPIPNRFIYDDREIEAICQSSDPFEIRCHEQRIGWKLAE
jgi:hypothetical protein